MYATREALRRVKIHTQNPLSWIIIELLLEQPIERIEPDALFMSCIMGAIPRPGDEPHDIAFKNAVREIGIVARDVLGALENFEFGETILAWEGVAELVPASFDPEAHEMLLELRERAEQCRELSHMQLHEDAATKGYNDAA